MKTRRPSQLPWDPTWHPDRPIFASTDPSRITAPGGPAPRPAMTREAWRYWAAEERWRRHLEGKAGDSHRTGRDQLDLAKAKARRAERREAYVHGSHPTPAGKYSLAEVEQLGKEGKALAKGDGTHWFAIAEYADIHNAVAAYRALKPGERDGVHKWIIERARAIGAEHLLPNGWGTFAEKLGPRETESGGTAELGGPFQ